MTMVSLALFLNQFADFLDRLNGADLVVGHHYADQYRIRAQRRAHVFDSDDPVFINRQTCDDPAAPFQCLQCAAHRRMLNRRSDDVPPMRFGELANAANRQVVGFCATGREDDFVRARANKHCYLAPGSIGSRPGFLTEQMDARGVAKLFRQIWHHRLDDPAVDRRGGAMIEINFAHSTVSGQLVDCQLPVTIADNWQLATDNGVPEYCIRTADAPALSLGPGIMSVKRHVCDCEAAMLAF